MKPTQAREVLAKLNGYWPTPAMTDEETEVWLDVLTDTQRHIRFEDATGLLSRLSSSEQFRPRPGSFSALARAQRSTEHLTNCPTCHGTTWREMTPEETPCQRGPECSQRFELCRCVVRCTRCDGTGKVPWAPEPGDAPDYGSIATRRVADLMTTPRQARPPVAAEPSWIDEPF